MSRVTLTVNGAPIAADIEPRLHLADFLREHLLLTGTHVGCEHGVCGACTILLDGEPARACITFVAACDGRDVRCIEGLIHDPIMVRLRRAFTAEHALQCGYCTPGMLVTARDIVRRIPHADTDRIRLELAGNLCRCTGYNGIVRAIERVLRDAPVFPTPADVVPVAIRHAVTPPVEIVVEISDPVAIPPGGPTLARRIALAVSRGEVWAALKDPALLAGCVPGAVITAVEGSRITGTVTAGLGPIQARFSGQGTITYNDLAYAGTLSGEGRDVTTGTRLVGRAAFHVEDGADHAILVLNIGYGLRGALAQFARGPVVAALADEIASQFGRNLAARLRGQAAPAAPAGSLVWRVLQRLMRRWRAPGDAANPE